MHNRYAFVGGDSGTWSVLSIRAVTGVGLGSAKRVQFATGDGPEPETGAAWTLPGLISNLRYATRAELSLLRAQQAGLGRPEARMAALIPIKKSPAWWELAQDERRAIFEETSHHTAIGLAYLPAIARQLFHCRDIGGEFDFLTWFEYAPEHASAFEQLVARLRATLEWSYVEREVDVRLKLE